MSKREFLTKLEEALLENMDIAQAAKHIKYYREYIESEIEKGISEEEVVASLQSPRLIAKNIINNSDSANKYDNNIKNHSSEQTYNSDQFSNKSEHKGDKSFDGITFSINGKPINSFWVKLIAMLAFIIIAVLVIAVIGGVIWLLFKVILPVVLIVGIVYFVIKIFAGNGK